MEVRWIFDGTCRCPPSQCLESSRPARKPPELQWAGPGTICKTTNPLDFFKKMYFDEFRRVSGELSNIVKIFKIDDFGGPSENPRKIVLGSFNIVKNNHNTFFWQRTYYFLPIILSRPPAAPKRGAAAFGRRPSFGQYLYMLYLHD